MNLPRNGSRKWVILLLTVLGTVTLGLASWAGTRLVDHEQRISKTEVHIEALHARDEALTQWLTRFDAKLDRVLERTP